VKQVCSSKADFLNFKLRFANKGKLASHFAFMFVHRRSQILKNGDGMNHAELI
jgi:hypothetical protein